MTSKLLPCLAAVLLSAGCATSPVALEEANHGLSLTMQLKQELETFAARQAAVNDLRKQQLGAIITAYNDRLLDLSGDDQLYEFSGQAKRLSAIRQLRSRAALLGAAASAKEAHTSYVEELIGQLTTPSPPIGENLGATGKAFGALGKELPFAERAALATSFFDEVHGEIKKNQDAAAVTAAASANELPAITTGGSTNIPPSTNSN